MRLCRAKVSIIFVISDLAAGVVICGADQIFLNLVSQSVEQTENSDYQKSHPI